jgi:NodT family efflux transporter outer membrane factor (OMF) lipoprotein
MLQQNKRNRVLSNALSGALALTLVSSLAGCMMGPNYRRPPVETPAAFKEEGKWKSAQPADAAPRGNWWAMYNDPVLDDLLKQVNVNNQNLLKAEAVFRQSQALVESARSQLFPTLSTNITYTRSRASANTIATPTSAPVSRGVVTSHSLPLTATWVPDFWGSVRRQIEENEANAQASVGDLETARLLAEATLAQAYFQVRSIDGQKKLFDETLVAYEKSLKLTQNQYNVGIVAKADVINAETQLKSAQAQAIDLSVLRDQLEHSIAVQLGKPPAEFTLPRMPLDALPPPIPVGLPSDLLERRPDVAAAERRMAAANAQIGVAKAAFFPTLTLSGTAGYQSSSLVNWISAPSRFWSVGPALAETLFDGGLRRAQTKNAIAAYDAAVATYRQTVLTGFQQVEDNLAALRVLEHEAEVQDEAIALSRQAVAIALNQYKAGTVTYINVITAQATQLTNERTGFDILNRRMTASVMLIEALGGGWDSALLPNNGELVHDSFNPVPGVKPSMKP